VAEAVVTLTVARSAQALDAIDDAVKVLEDSAENVIDVLANDTNREGLPVTVVITSGLGKGTATVVDNAIHYTPAANATGSDTLTYALQVDGVTRDAAQVAITIVNLNDTPMAVPDTFTLQENCGTSLLNVLINDTDDDGDPLTIVEVTAPFHGVVALTNGQVRYTPAPNYFGEDGFLYRIQDPAGAEATGIVSITILRVEADNQAPTAVDDLAVVPMNGAGRLIDVLGNDQDEDGDTPAVTVPAQGTAGYPTHGALMTLTVAGQPDTICYIPATDYFGYDSFTYRIDDGYGGVSSATVNVVVYKLTINVSPGFCVPMTNRWGVPVGYSTDSVQLLVDTLPESIDLSAMTIAWTGATIDPEAPASATMGRGVTGVTPVAVSVIDEDHEASSASAEVVVAGIDHLASDDANLIEAESGNSTNAITGVSTNPSTVTVRAVLSPATPDMSPVYNQLMEGNGRRNGGQFPWVTVPYNSRSYLLTITNLSYYRSIKF
jgi:hypothetical protein